jgi:hypothetical protein
MGCCAARGPQAVLSYHSAAELDHLIDDPAAWIHLTVPRARRVSPIRGVQLHRSERVRGARHPALTPPRTRIEETVLDLAGAAPALGDACGWIARAVGRRLTTPGRLSAAVQQRQRLRWRTELTELLAADAAGAHSVLE